MGGWYLLTSFQQLNEVSCSPTITGGKESVRHPGVCPTGRASDAMNVTFDARYPYREIIIDYNLNVL